MQLRRRCTRKVKTLGSSPRVQRGKFTGSEVEATTLMQACDWPIEIMGKWNFVGMDADKGQGRRGREHLFSIHSSYAVHTQYITDADNRYLSRIDPKTVDGEPCFSNNCLPFKFRNHYCL